jgi:hypothetical protein
VLCVLKKVMVVLQEKKKKTQSKNSFVDTRNKEMRFDCHIGNKFRKKKKNGNHRKIEFAGVLISRFAFVHGASERKKKQKKNKKTKTAQQKIEK